MSTELLREKLNSLTNWIASETLQIFQHELLIEAASKTTGDKQVDEEMRRMAQNAKSVVLACSRRLSVYRAKHSQLEAELNASQPEE